MCVTECVVSITPLPLLQMGSRSGTMHTAHKDHIMTGIWKDCGGSGSSDKKKNVSFLTTGVSPYPMYSQRRKQKGGRYTTVDRPQTLKVYDKNMNAIDVGDQTAVGTVIHLRRVRKWWKHAFAWLLNQTAHNARILYHAAVHRREEEVKARVVRERGEDEWGKMKPTQRLAAEEDMFGKVMSRLPTTKEFNMELVMSMLCPPARVEPDAFPAVHRAVEVPCVWLKAPKRERKRCVVCQSDITKARRLAIMGRGRRGRGGRTGCGTAQQARKCLYYCDKHEGGPVGLCAVARSPRTRTCWDVFHEDPEQFVVRRRHKSTAAGSRGRSPPPDLVSPVSARSATRTPSSAGASISPPFAPPGSQPPTVLVTVNVAGAYTSYGAPGAAGAPAVAVVGTAGAPSTVGVGLPAVPGLVPTALFGGGYSPSLGRLEQV